MKRRIKKLLDYRKSHEEKCFKAIFNSSMIIGAVIFGLIAFKYNEPKKMASSDIDYCKEKVEKISKNDLRDYVEVINQLKENGYEVSVDYENYKITVSYTDQNSEKIIFSKTKNENISYKRDLSYAESNQIIVALVVGVIGSVGGPVALIIISAIFLVICYIIEWIQKIAEKIKK